MYQLLLAIEVFVAFVAVAVCFRAFKPFRLRRFSVLIGLCILLACFRLINNSSIIPAPRAVVVVIPSDLTDTKDLEKTCKALRWFDSVTFVAVNVSADTPPSRKNGKLVWQLSLIHI